MAATQAKLDEVKHIIGKRDDVDFRDVTGVSI